MTSILLIEAASALLICAITAKVITREPKKASKSQKAEIMKQLLALSDGESKISGAASAARQRPLPNQRTLPGNAPRKTTTIPRALRTQ